MITGISIENFKGIRERVDIELRPLTLLFGANSAGKSTILQAIHLVHEVFNRQNPDADRTNLGGGAIDLGGFQSFVHGRQRELPVKIGFKIKLDAPDELLNLDSLETVGQY